MTKLAFVVSAPETADAFLTPHFEALIDEFDISLVANSKMQNWPSVPEVHVHQVDIERTPSLFKDLAALSSLRKYFKRQGIQIIQSVTPKAGLLAMVAGKLASTPIRIHWFTGQVWATRSGFSRAYLKFADKLTARMATHLLVDSPSQRQFLIEQKIAPAEKMTVLGSGSICGVNPHRFQPNKKIRQQIRQSLDISDGDLVVLFMGRLCTDKGVHDLLSMYTELPEETISHLVLVGVDEEDIEGQWKRRLVSSHKSVQFIGHSAEPEKYMAASDIFVMPSHREGFGLSVIEAAATGLPSIGSNIYGLCDAIEDGETGLLVPVSDRDSWEKALCYLLLNDGERIRLGRNARNRALTHFRSEFLTQEYFELLMKLSGK